MLRQDDTEMTEIASSLLWHCIISMLETATEYKLSFTPCSHFLYDKLITQSTLFLRLIS